MKSFIDYELIAKTLFIVYGLALFYLFCYGLIQIHLVYQYLKARKKKETHNYNTHSYPFVTVQLPVYNEKYVIKRLIDAIAAFDYPIEKLEVQVLDDSTDETKEIVALQVAYWKSRGLNIEHIQRQHRNGYKAGALLEGLRSAKGELIAIFDADFVPEPDFLKKTIPYFQDESIGMVQTRWDHLNKQFSLLTHFQAFLLDAHFSIEQSGRNNAGYFINFSGTGGIWRKSCIEDAGGWNSDTLTEDFDLSYRAQLKGWKFKFLEEVGSPAELPPVLSALKSQQFRWIKGNTETARKHLPGILKAKIPRIVKIHAFFHLMVGLVFISAFLASFLSIPLLILKYHVPQMRAWYNCASFSLLSLIFLGVFHYVSTLNSPSSKENASNSYFFKTFPLYLAFSMGISLHNALAVVEGLIGIKTPFVRTPKFNISHGKINSKNYSYKSGKRSFLFIVEAAMVVYFLWGGFLAFYYKDFTMFPYHLMLSFGFGMLCYFSFDEFKGGEKWGKINLKNSLIVSQKVTANEKKWS